MPEAVQIKLDGHDLTVPAGTTAAAAILLSGASKFRNSVTGEPRAALCGMGICFECRVTINGRSDCRSCQVLVKSGMEVSTS